MSKYVSVGNTAVSLEALKDLSGEDKIRMMDAMFNGCGMETDNHGQIIQYTGLKFGDDQHRTVVKFQGAEAAPNDVEDDNEPDPYEAEEEPISSDTYEEELPPTLRPSDLPAVLNS